MGRVPWHRDLDISSTFWFKEEEKEGEEEEECEEEECEEKGEEEEEWEEEEADRLPQRSTLLVVKLLATHFTPGMAERVRELSWMVPRSDEPCMIMFDYEEERARMSCGHAIMPESLHSYCVDKLRHGNTELTCPYQGPDTDNEECGAVWPLQEVRLKACWNAEEYAYAESKISCNVISQQRTVQQCPGCLWWSERMQPGNNRVKCLNCSNTRQQSHDFCWLCSKPWLEGGTDFCGNDGCASEEETLRILRTCPKKNISGKNCPSKRACPKCGALIEHTSGCPQMICRYCKTEFCFLCLRVVRGGHTPCNLARIQTQLAKN
ncbi:hypothetical protein ScPMuIL_008976 [Solemya velum]